MVGQMRRSSRERQGVWGSLIQRAETACGNFTEFCFWELGKIFC
jgi:hypothetical protein